MPDTTNFSGFGTERRYEWTEIYFAFTVHLGRQLIRGYSLEMTYHTE